MKEPLRLVDDPEQSSALLRDMEVACRAEAPFDQGAGLSRLLAAIAAGGAVSAAGVAEAAGHAGASTQAATTAAQAAATAGQGASTAAQVASVAGQGASTAAQVASVAGQGATTMAQGAAVTGGVAAKSLAFLLGKGAYWGLAAAAVASVTLTISFATDDSRRPSPLPPSTAVAAAPALSAYPGTPADPAPPAPDDSSAAHDPPAPAGSNPTPGSSDPLAAAQPSVALRPTTPATSAPAASTAPAPAASAPVDPALAAEVRHLSEMRARLADRPEEVVSGAAAGTATFTSGALAEEREALAIEALAKLGRKEEARARAAAFHARYPKSPLGAHLRALVRD
jgi:hypothetical protein